MTHDPKGVNVAIVNVRDVDPFGVGARFPASRGSRSSAAADSLDPRLLTISPSG